MSSLISSYKIFTNYNLIIEFHTGIMNVDSYINFKKLLSKDTDFKAGMNNFIHFKNVSFSITEADIQKFVNFIKANSSVLGKRKVALLTNTPKQVVATTIYQSLQAGLNQQVEIFSTTDSALNWLTKNKNIRELKNIISTFERNS